MRSWVEIHEKSASASGGNTHGGPSGFMSLTQRNGSYTIWAVFDAEGKQKKFTEAEMKCLRECIDRLLPRRKK